MKSGDDSFVGTRFTAHYVRRSLGTGVITLGVDRVSFAGAERITSRGRVVAAAIIGGLALVIGAAMIATDAGSLRGIVGGLVATSLFVLMRRHRRVPFCWTLPWAEVEIVKQLGTRTWRATLSGVHRGKLDFSTPAEQTADLARQIDVANKMVVTRVRLRTDGVARFLPDDEYDLLTDVSIAPRDEHRSVVV